MRHRKRQPKRKKDILDLTLKNMPVLDELICTKKTFDNIQSRLALFSSIYTDRNYKTFARQGTWIIKRYA